MGRVRSLIVRRLQDISSQTGEFPQQVQLPELTDRRHIGGGGEASIWLAKLDGKEVISRECAHPSDGDWEGEEGKLILKVSGRVLRCSHPFNPYIELNACQIAHKEVLTLLQISHKNIVPFLGVVSDEHHPLALISPYYNHGHASAYLWKLDSVDRPAASIHIVSFL